MRGSLHLLSNYRPYLVWSLYRRPLSCRGNMAFSLRYFDVRFVGAILVNARPKRNISATIVADVKRFSHQINTDEVFGTRRAIHPITRSPRRARSPHAGALRRQEQIVLHRKPQFGHGVALVFFANVTNVQRRDLPSIFDLQTRRRANNA